MSGWQNELPLPPPATRSLRVTQFPNLPGLLAIPLNRYSQTNTNVTRCNACVRRTQCLCTEGTEYNTIENHIYTENMPQLESRRAFNKHLKQQTAQSLTHIDLSSLTRTHKTNTSTNLSANMATERQMYLNAAQEQGNTKLTECKHVVSFHYPDLELLNSYPENPHAEHWVLSTVPDAKNRYEPLPLVLDADAARHNSRDSVEETRISTMSPAPKVLKDIFELDLEAIDPESDRLVRDMDTLQQYLGETELRAVAFENPLKEDEVFVRIQRFTSLRRSGAPRIAQGRVYTMDLIDFYKIQHASSWAIQLKSLMLRLDDKAYRHVRARIALSRNPNVPVEDFLPRRNCAPDASQYDPSPSVEGQECPICRLDLVQEKIDAVCTPCSKNHIFCKPCLIKWIDSVPHGMATCPMCRTNLLASATQTEDARFGLTNGVYRRLLIFNDFENFERACADLDHRLATEQAGTFVPDRRILANAWLEMEVGALLEPPTYAPYAMQPFCLPEYALFRDAIYDFFAAGAGAEVSIATFARQALERAEQRMQAEIARHVPAALRPANDPWIVFRPGVKEFLARTINRVVQFQLRRQCACGQARMHEHGGRDFWGPEQA